MSLSRDENANFSFSLTNESISSSKESLTASSAASIRSISRGTNGGISFANLPDLCLTQIFTHVTAIRERVTCVELTCKRWRELSLMTNYAGKTMLRMEFDKEEPRILVYFQDVDADELEKLKFPSAQSGKSHFEVPWPCTNTCRHWNGYGEADLPEVSTRFFQEFLGRCSKNIRSLSFGGLKESAGNMKSMTALFPSSFLEMITEACPNLDSLYLRSTVLQPGTMHILQLREDFPNIGTRLKRLCLHDSHFKDTSVLDFQALSPSLREVSLSTNLFKNLENLENSLRISGNDHPGLKFCQLQLITADYKDNENYERKVKYVLDRSEGAEVWIKLDLLQGPRMRTALSSMFTCTSVTTLTLILHGSSLGNMQMTNLFAGIGEMGNLESLKIFGNRGLFYCSSLRSLVLDGLRKLKKFHTLELLDVMSEVQESGWTDCLSGLRNLKSFRLRMGYGFNDEHLLQLVENNPGLEDFCIEQCETENFWESLPSVLSASEHMQAIRVEVSSENMPAFFKLLFFKKVDSNFISITKFGEPTPEEIKAIEEDDGLTVAVKGGLFMYATEDHDQYYCQLCKRRL